MSDLGFVSPCTSLEISVWCSNLGDLDVMSKSDPICIVSEEVNGNWQETGRSERVQNTLNPKWTTKFVVNYHRGAEQRIKLEVFDSDGGSNLDFLGRVETTMDSIVVGSNNYFVSILRESPKCKASKIFVVTEELEQGLGDAQCRLQFAADQLDNKDFFSKSDPFFELSKSTPSGMFVLVYRSEMIKNNLSPLWQPCTLSLRQLCSNNYDRPLLLEIYDYDTNGAHDLIGSLKTNLGELTSSREKTLPVINSKKLGKRHYKDSGKIILKSYQINN